MENKYGETNWGDVKTSGGNDFINLVQGSNKFRVVTKPYQFVVHWTKDPSGANKKLRCTTKNCPVCQHLDVKAQYRWYVGVISRQENKCGILEISSQIMTGIKSLVEDDDWGDPSSYDIDVTRGPKGSQPLYNVNPKPHKKLTKSEETMVANFLENLNLAKMVVPPTPEALTEKLLDLGFDNLGSSADDSDDGEDTFNFEDE
jgi:hypothetical protein